MLRHEITPERALARLEQMCARAEHSTGEVADRLRRWQIAPADAERIIEQLHGQRYVDDERFARAYVNDKVRFARWGRRKVQQGLWLKRIDHTLAEHVLDTIDQDLYTDNLRQLYRQKIQSAPSLLDSYEGRTKLYRAALSRGYEPDLAASILRDLLSK